MAQQKPGTSKDARISIAKARRERQSVRLLYYVHGISDGQVVLLLDFCLIQHKAEAPDFTLSIFCLHIENAMVVTCLHVSKHLQRCTDKDGKSQVCETDLLPHSCSIAGLPEAKQRST